MKEGNIISHLPFSPNAPWMLHHQPLLPTNDIDSRPIRL